MNKIFKVVWSKARNCYVVVSETAKNTTKGCSSKKLIAMLVATGVLSAGVSMNAFAANATIDNSGFLGDILTSEQIGTKDANGVNLNIYSVTAEGAISGASLASEGAITAKGAISGASLASEGAITAEGAVKGATLESTGNTKVGGNLSVTGAISGASVTATGAVKGATLESTGDAKVGGNLSVTGRIKVTEIEAPIINSQDKYNLLTYTAESGSTILGAYGYDTDHTNRVGSVTAKGNSAVITAFLYDYYNWSGTARNGEILADKNSTIIGSYINSYGKISANQRSEIIGTNVSGSSSGDRVDSEVAADNDSIIMGTFINEGGKIKADYHGIVIGAQVSKGKNDTEPGTIFADKGMIIKGNVDGAGSSIGTTTPKSIVIGAIASQESSVTAKEKSMILNTYSNLGSTIETSAQVLNAPQTIIGVLADYKSKVTTGAGGLVMNVKANEGTVAMDKNLPGSTVSATGAGGVINVNVRDDSSVLASGQSTVMSSEIWGKSTTASKNTVGNKEKTSTTANTSSVIMGAYASNSVITADSWSSISAIRADGSKIRASNRGVIQGVYANKAIIRVDDYSMLLNGTAHEGSEIKIGQWGNTDTSGIGIRAEKNSKVVISGAQSSIIGSTAEEGKTLASYSKNSTIIGSVNSKAGYLYGEDESDDEDYGKGATVIGSKNAHAKADYSTIIGSTGTSDDKNITYSQYATIIGSTNSVAGKDGDINIYNVGDRKAMYATVIGSKDSIASGLHSAVVGADSGKATGKYSVAIGGYSVEATGENSFAFGSSAKATNYYAIAFGNSSQASAYDAIAIGRGSQAPATSAIAIGNDAKVSGTSTSEAIALGDSAYVSKSRGVALGSLSSASEGVIKTSGWDILTGTNSNLEDRIWRANLAEVSVGSSYYTRRITGVAAGVNDTDAVNVAQLKAVKTYIDNIYYSAKVEGDSSNMTNTIVQTNNNIQVPVPTVEDVDKAKAAGTDTPPATTGQTTTINTVKYVVSGPKVDKEDPENNDPANVVSNLDITAKGTGDDATSVNFKDTDTQYTVANDANTGNGSVVLNSNDGEAPQKILEAGYGLSINANNVISLDKSVIPDISFEESDKAYVGDVGSVTIAPVDAMIIYGGVTNESELTEQDNIGVVAKDGGLKVRLAQNIKLGDNGSVEMGDTTVNNKGLTINNSKGGKKIEVTGDNISMGDNQVHDVQAGTAPTDAVNVSQLKNLEGKVDNRINKVGARAAALAALHPLDFDPDDKLTFAAGYGHYKGENAGAIGAFYRPDEKVMFSVAGTVAEHDTMINAGISFSLDRTPRQTTTKTAMARDILEMKEQIAALAANNKALTAQNNQFLKVLGNATGLDGKPIEMSRVIMFPDVPENHWAYEYVEGLMKRGIIEGYPDGNYSGDRSCTRYEFAAMLYRALKAGQVVPAELTLEFASEIGRFRVDRVHGADDSNNKIERIRVNGDHNYGRDNYGSKNPQPVTSRGPQYPESAKVK